MENDSSFLLQAEPYSQKLHLLINRLTEGLTMGQHTGKRRGVGTEFSEYRAYQPGDDVRLIDWKMYGRSDRFYLRESEAESSFTFRFFIDDSASMEIREKGYSKKEWSLLMLYILSSIGFQQRDELYFYHLGKENSHKWKPQYGKSAFIASLSEFSTYTSVRELLFKNLSTLSKTLTSNKPEWWIILSDFIQHKNELEHWISSINHPKRAITCFRVKTPNEHLLPSDSKKLKDIENDKSTWINSTELNRRYTKNYESYFEELSVYIKSLGIEWVEGTTDTEPGKFISTWLKHRNRSVAK